MNIDILAFTGSFRSQSELFIHQQPSLRIEKVGGASFKYGFMTEKCTELRSQPGDGKLPSKVTASGVFAARKRLPPGRPACFCSRWSQKYFKEQGK